MLTNNKKLDSPDVIEALNLPITNLSQLEGGVRGKSLYQEVTCQKAKWYKFTQFLQKPNAKVNCLCEQGFTLLESLMGMVVISIVVVAITPPIFLTVATRVQNRRAEQAMQLAQGEVDRVRVLMEQGSKSNLPAVASGLSNDITSGSTPTTLSTTIKSNNTSCSNLDTGTQVAANKALRVDINRDCQPDFLVQTFRDDGTKVIVGGNEVPIVFRMGVRVYAAMAKDNLNNLEKSCASLKLTTGEGGQRKRPLAAMYTTVARSDSTTVSLTKYKAYINTLSTGDPDSKCGL